MCSDEDLSSITSVCFWPCLNGMKTHSRCGRNAMRSTISRRICVRMAPPSLSIRTVVCSLQLLASRDINYISITPVGTIQHQAAVHIPQLASPTKTKSQTSSQPVSPRIPSERDVSAQAGGDLSPSLRSKNSPLVYNFQSLKAHSESHFETQCGTQRFNCSFKILA